MPPKFCASGAFVCIAIMKFNIDFKVLRFLSVFKITLCAVIYCHSPSFRLPSFWDANPLQASVTLRRNASFKQNKPVRVLFLLLNL